MYAKCHSFILKHLVTSDFVIYFSINNYLHIFLFHTVC